MKEKFRSPGEAVADGGIQAVGGGVPLPGVQADDRLALGPGGFLAEGRHPLGKALPGLGRVDASPLEIVLRNVFDVSPCRDIRAKTYADNPVYA